MELTININTQQPKVDAFLNFIKSLFTALDELKDAREGKIKLGNLEDLLNEI